MFDKPIRLKKTMIKFCYSYLPARKICSNQMKQNESEKIVVSLTSHGERLKMVHIAIKSIMNQTIQPDKIVLYLTHDDFKCVPRHLLRLQKKGLQIIDVGENNIKSHNKYYHAFVQYPEDIVITVDDDGMYERSLIEVLYESYKKYPNCVSAKRCHKIEHDKYGSVMKYNDWGYECVNVLKPDRNLFATGVGGVLYPPKLLRESMFSMDEIKSHCLNADDVMLKFMEIKENVDVVWARGSRLSPIEIEESPESGLALFNNIQNGNDMYIKNMEKLTGIAL